MEWVASERQSKFLLSDEDEVLYGGAAGGGKLLDIGTPIPTPGGFVLLGDIHPGDMVMGRDGAACLVLYESEEVTRTAWRLVFDDGSELIADAEHLWLTFDVREREALLKRTPEYRARRRRNRASHVKGNKSKEFVCAVSRSNRERRGEGVKPPPSGTVRTTAEIVDTLRVRGDRVNHAIPVAAPLDLPGQVLPLDPYLLGVWLGDGTSHVGSVTTQDDEVVQAFVDAGFPVMNVYETAGNAASFYSFKGLTRVLGGLGVLDNKHVPEEYLWGSKEQRLALLQGLMDSDGTASGGSAEFCNTNKNLVDSTYHLIVSLGMKAAVGVENHDGNEAHSPFWRIKWRPNAKVFRISYKRREQATATRQTTRFRYVVDAQEVPKSTMKCLQVDAPDSLFLAGKSMIPTHNTDSLLVLQAVRSVEIPFHKGLFLRRTFPELERSAIRRSLELFSGLGARYDKRAKTWHFPNGSLIDFGYLQYEEDVQQYQSAEYDTICFDELTHFTEDQYTYLISRNRTTKPGVNPWMRSGTNPGGVGHAWVKARFVDSGAPEERTYVTHTNKETGEVMRRSRKFIPAKVQDNPYLPKSYVAGLMELPQVVQDRLLHGNWDVAEGLAFVEFSRDVHVVPYAHTVIPDSWERFRSLDWGYSRPYSVGWYAVDYDGRLWRYRELYGWGGNPDKGSMESPGEVAEKILMIEKEAGEDIRHAVADDAIFGGRQDHGKTIAEQFMDAGVFWTPVGKGPGSREAGKIEVHHRLRPLGWSIEDEMRADAAIRRPSPGLMIVDNCRHFLRTFPSLPLDMRNPEDVNTKSEDHAYDELRYACMSRPIAPTRDRAADPPLAAAKKDVVKRLRDGDRRTQMHRNRLFR